MSYVKLRVRRSVNFRKHQNVSFLWKFQIDNIHVKVFAGSSARSRIKLKICQMHFLSESTNLGLPKCCFTRLKRSKLGTNSKNIEVITTNLSLIPFLLPNLKSQAGTLFKVALKVLNSLTSSLGEQRWWCLSVNRAKINGPNCWWQLHLRPLR